MLVAAHQPNLLPGLGYLAKFFRSEVFLTLDHVDMAVGSRDSFTHRTMVGYKAQWLTIPVGRHRQPINTVKVSPSQYFATIENELFGLYGREAQELLDEVVRPACKLASEDNLAHLNRVLLFTFTYKLSNHNHSLSRPMVMSAREWLGAEVRGGGAIVEAILAKQDSVVYLTGSGGKSYLADREDLLPRCRYMDWYDAGKVHAAESDLWDTGEKLVYRSAAHYVCKYGLKAVAEHLAASVNAETTAPMRQHI